jgi:hypothetical protein
VTAWEVPHIRKPPPAWGSVTQQQLVPPTQDHGYNVVILHRPSIPLSRSRDGLATHTAASDRPRLGISFATFTPRITIHSERELTVENHCG